MTNCDPSKLPSQNGQSSFLRGTKQPIKPDKKSRIRRQTLAAEADFLPAPNPISSTDFSYFLDWFAEEHFAQEKGLKCDEVSVDTSAELSPPRLYNTIFFSPHQPNLANPQKCEQSKSKGRLCFICCRLDKLTPSHHLSASWNCSNVPVKYIEVVKLLSIRDELFWACIINRKWE